MAGPAVSNLSLLIGRYHSHPLFAVLPSQASYRLSVFCARWVHQIAVVAVALCFGTLALLHAICLFNLQAFKSYSTRVSLLGI